MKTREDFFKTYLSKTAVAMAFWRSMESEKYSREKIKGPVLDVGCGDGYFAKVVFETPLEAGIDLDEGEVKRAVKSGSYKKAIHASVTDIPLPSRSFNTVISNCVLEHVPEIDKGLKEIARVLKPGGRLMITVPSECYNECSIFQEWLKFFGLHRLSQLYIDGLNKVFKHSHVNHSKIWAERFRRAGLKLERADYFISIRAFHVYEFWLIPSLPTKLWKVLFGRWVLLPRFWVKWFAPAMVRGAMFSESPKGVCYFLIARKK